LAAPQHILPGLQPLFALANDRLGDAFVGAQHELEQLPYFLRSAFTAVELVVEVQREVVSRRLPSLKRGSVGLFAPDEHVLLSYHMDGFLFAARRSQDAILPFIKRLGITQNLPRSMSDLVKGLRGSKRESWSLDPEIEKICLNYWDSHGLRLKQYRDLASHYCVVSSEANYFYGPDGEPGVYLGLPNNPGCRSPADLSYEPPTLAVPYCLKEYFELVGFLDRLVERLIDLAAGDMDPVKARRRGIILTPYKRRRLVFDGRGFVQPGHVLPPEGVVLALHSQFLRAKRSAASGS